MFDELTIISAVICFFIQIASIIISFETLVNAPGFLRLSERISVIVFTLIFNCLCLLALFGPYEETILDTKICEVEIKNRQAFFFYNDHYIRLSNYYSGIVQDGDMVKVTDSRRDATYSLYYTWNIRTVQVLDKDSNLVNTHEQALP